MKKILSFLMILGGIALAGCQHSGTKAIDLSTIDPGDYDSTWWNREPYRLVQTNLREIDASMDRNAYIK